MFQLHADAGLVRLVTYEDDGHIAQVADARWYQFQSIGLAPGYGLRALANQARASADALYHVPGTAYGTVERAEAEAAYREGAYDQEIADFDAYTLACPGD